MWVLNFIVFLLVIWYLYLACNKLVHMQHWLAVIFLITHQARQIIWCFMFQWQSKSKNESFPRKGWPKDLWFCIRSIFTVFFLYYHKKKLKFHHSNTIYVSVNVKEILKTELCLFITLRESSVTFLPCFWQDFMKPKYLLFWNGLRHDASERNVQCYKVLLIMWYAPCPRFPSCFSHGLLLVCYCLFLFLASCTNPWGESMDFLSFS